MSTTGNQGEDREPGQDWEQGQSMRKGWGRASRDPHRSAVPAWAAPGMHCRTHSHPSPTSSWGPLFSPKGCRALPEATGSTGSTENRSLPLCPAVSWAHGGGGVATGVQHRCAGVCACASTALCRGSAGSSPGAALGAPGLSHGHGRL